MAAKKKRPTKKPNQSELTITVGIDDRYYNVPTIERRSQKMLTPKEAVSRARKRGLLGRGYPTLKEAVSAAGARSKSLGRAIQTGRGKAPQKSGGRTRRRGQLMGAMEPYNPGGKEPRGGGGKPRRKKKAKK